MLYTNMSDAFLEGNAGQFSGFFQGRSVVTRSPAGTEYIDVFQVETDRLGFKAIGHCAIQHSHTCMIIEHTPVSGLYLFPKTTKRRNDETTIASILGPRKFVTKFDCKRERRKVCVCFICCIYTPTSKTNERKSVIVSTKNLKESHI
jgi:hypothetical protein